MRTSEASDRVKSNRGGHGLLLMMLLAIAVVVVFYMVRSWGPGVEIGTGKTDTTPPWKQWQKLQVKLRKEPVGRPTEEQLELSEPIGFTAEAYEGDADRGQVAVFLTPDGNVAGDWTGQYYITKKLDHQVMMSNFKGCIVPSEVYEDANEQDPSKLYFIGKGSFSVLETNAETGRVRNVMGSIYATGWVDTERYFTGKITITSDEKHFKAYYWEGPSTKNAVMSPAGFSF